MNKSHFNNYDDAIEFLTSGLTKSGGNIFRGESGLAKTRRFLSLLGNPQDSLRAVHIAGTSGKGTVAYMVRAILHEHGFSTGLIISPHAYDIRERFQINNKLIAKPDLLEAINTSLPAIIDRFLVSESPSYFQANTAIGLSEMERNKVDYAVVETGLGGLYDSTNVLDREDKVCVITRLGKDHEKILGSTYAEIALQKAGIIKPKNQVITFAQRKTINDVISQFASSQSAHMHNVNLSNYKELHQSLTNVSLTPYFQLENISLAVEACEYLAGRDNWLLYPDKVWKALNNIKIPARFEQYFSHGHEFIFDGAHNPQKLKALAAQYSAAYQEKATVIMALKSDKHARDSIAAIAPITDKIIFTKFLAGQDFAAMAHEPSYLSDIATRINIKSEVVVSAADAVRSLEGATPIIVTGSNYLLGEIRQLLDN